MHEHVNFNDAVCVKNACIVLPHQIDLAACACLFGSRHAPPAVTGDGVFHHQLAHTLIRPNYSHHQTNSAPVTVAELKCEISPLITQVWCMQGRSWQQLH